MCAFLRLAANENHLLSVVCLEVENYKKKEKKHHRFSFIIHAANSSTRCVCVRRRRRRQRARARARPIKKAAAATALTRRRRVCAGAAKHTKDKRERRTKHVGEGGGAALRSLHICTCTRTRVRGVEKQRRACQCAKRRRALLSLSRAHVSFEHTRSAPGRHTDGGGGATGPERRHKRPALLPPTKGSNRRVKKTKKCRAYKTHRAPERERVRQKTSKEGRAQTHSERHTPARETQLTHE